MSLIVLIGASGAGKTTIARAIAERPGTVGKIFFFDSIGIPPVEEMIRQHGSGEAWQRAKTIAWMIRLAEATENAPWVLFEGQTRFSFLSEGAQAAGGVAYTPILVDCDDATRARRLRNERKQSELAGEEMMNWARYLRAEAVAHGHPILDTSRLSLPACVDWVIGRLGDQGRPGRA
jgi:signal recognition particle receptor subunit beta